VSSPRAADGRQILDWKEWLLLIALYTTTVVVFFVIPVRNEFSSVLLGSAVFRHDAVLNAGILEWGYRSLWSSTLHVFDWPAGYPFANALAGTENLIGWQLFYSPMRAAGATVAASYNFALLASLVVSGIACAALARRYGVSRFGAAVAGFAFAFNPFHLEHTIHLQTMAVCWSPFAILALDMTLEKHSVRALVLLGTSFVLTVLCGMYFGIFLSIVLIGYAIAAWSAGRYRLEWRGVRDLMRVGVAATAVVFPLIWHYVTFARSFGAYPHSSAELALSSPVELRELLGWLLTRRQELA
jgi:hypothetical protein